MTLLDAGLVAATAWIAIGLVALVLPARTLYPVGALVGLALAVIALRALFEAPALQRGNLRRELRQPRARIERDTGGCGSPGLPAAAGSDSAGNPDRRYERPPQVDGIALTR